jgi:hypothetical protein
MIVIEEPQNEAALLDSMESRTRLEDRSKGSLAGLKWGSGD